MARTAEHIGYRPHTPALVLLDFDTKAMPDDVSKRLDMLGGFWPALLTVVPELGSAARATRCSTSSGIARSDTGEMLPGSNGVHVFVLIRDGADAERFLKALHDRCWLAGLGWMMVGAGGQFLERSIVDRMVFAAERLVFEGAPILHGPLVQDAALRAPQATEGEAIDTSAVCRSLTLVEQARARQAKAVDRQRIAPAVAASRVSFVKVQGERIAKRVGISVVAAERMAERQCGGVLLPSVILPFDAEDRAGATVADVLADPAGFVGATLSDPLEGVEYGRSKAMVMQRPDGTLWINSFAHGRIAYELKHDAVSVESAIDAADPADAVNVLVRMLLIADVEADEEQHLREKASVLANIKARPAAAKIKAARARQAAAQAADRRERAEASNATGRLRLDAPPPDAERVPVIRAIDEVLCGVSEDEPPMRDMDGHPVEIRERQPAQMHELTSSGSNHVEAKDTRLPAPALPLLTAHNRFSLAHMIEHHIEFIDADAKVKRLVALPPTFIDHYSAFRDSELPRVRGIITAPLVTGDGTMLASAGLDRDRQLVFRIPHELRDILPKPGSAKPSAKSVAAALDYLVNEWLVDVATTFAGKCVLITLALTIIQRVLLPERPAFWITAGKRGGGKTTSLAMPIVAVTGAKPAAAAWSFSEEERRKALLAYLGDGIAALTFDNIPLGSTISCPTVEKILTAETYSDRILGVSETRTVPAFTVLAFTGNNISPRGDLSSRSLMARLDVDRPDPENRPFKHSDPIAWTLDNRGRILRALYVLLLANPQLTEPKAPKTRFKRWWHLVGSAVEHAAAELFKAEAGKPQAERTATSIDFNELFASVEGEDEEGTIIADVLEILHETFPGRYFQTSALTRLINDPMAGETDKAERLKAYFGQATSRQKTANVSVVSVGKRLASMIDVPLMAGDRVLKLKRHQPMKASAKHQVAEFIVEVVG